MLRHYDAMGLLAPPTSTSGPDAAAYEVSQLARLNRLVVLKELGFTLQQVKAILDEVDPVELHGMLRLRRMELEAQIDPTWRGWPRSRGAASRRPTSPAPTISTSRSGRWSRCGSPSDPASRRATTTRQASPRSSSRCSTRSSRRWAPRAHLRPVGPALSHGTNAVPGTEVRRRLLPGERRPRPARRVRRRRPAWHRARGDRPAPRCRPKG